MRYLVLIILFFINNLFSKETLPKPDEVDFTQGVPEVYIVESNEKKYISQSSYIYGSGYVFLGLPIPGVGLSHRYRENYKGAALDLTANGVIIYNSVSVQTSYVQYLTQKHTSPYLSAGVGIMGLMSLLEQFSFNSILEEVFPVLPVRTGIQGKYGFFDIGGVGVFPRGQDPMFVTEARCGLNLSF